MTRVTHTPGPWVAWDDGITIGIETDDGNPIAVAEVIDHSDWADPGQMLADQRLITAAPDLLAALENLCVLYDRLDRRGATGSAAYLAAVAAIAKAKAPGQ